jgi:hypothetical protein
MHESTYGTSHLPAALQNLSAIRASRTQGKPAAWQIDGFALWLKRRARRDPVTLSPTKPAKTAGNRAKPGRP